MPCDSELDEVLAPAVDAAADGVMESEVDGQRARAFPLRDQIELAKVRAANACCDGTGRRRRTIRLIRVIPPGAV